MRTYLFIYFFLSRKSREENWEWLGKGQGIPVPTEANGQNFCHIELFTHFCFLIYLCQKLFFLVLPFQNFHGFLNIEALGDFRQVFLPIKWIYAFISCESNFLCMLHRWKTLMQLGKQELAKIMRRHWYSYIFSLTIDFLNPEWMKG